MGADSVNEDCAPSWIQKELIVDALLNDDPAKDVSNVRIVSVEVVEGGYLSKTFRVVARSDDGKFSWETPFIVKADPQPQGQIRDVIMESGVYEKETAAYCHFLPSVNDLLMKIEGENWQPLAPKLYFHGTQPICFFILEDLVASGFSKVKPTTNLNLDQCRAVIHNIARMHASSLLVLDDERYSKENFRKSLIFNENIMSNIDGMHKYYRQFVKMLHNHPQLKLYTDKMLINLPDLIVASVKVVKNSRDHFKVMLHGDLHKNNMMLRTQDRSTQACFFDFQGLHIGSPAEDLLYFMHSSARVEVLRDHMDQLLCEYHGTLQYTMRALGLHQQADAYPLDQLHKDMDHFGLVALFTVLHVLPIVLCPNTTDLPTDATADDYEEKIASFLQKHCNTERYMQYMEHLIPLFNSKGLLDPTIV